MEINKKIGGLLSIFIFVLCGCATQSGDVVEKNETSSIKVINECQAEKCDDVIISESVGAVEFKKKVDSGGYMVIDIRTPEEHQEEQINIEQQNIDIYADDFSDEIKKLERDKKYLIYCRSGSRTKMGLNRMKAFGFTEVYDLDGGFKEWEENKFPTTKVNM